LKKSKPKTAATNFKKNGLRNAKKRSHQRKGGKKKLIRTNKEEEKPGDCPDILGKETCKRGKKGKAWRHAEGGGSAAHLPFQKRYGRPSILGKEKKGKILTLEGGMKKNSSGPLLRGRGGVRGQMGCKRKKPTAFRFGGGKGRKLPKKERKGSEDELGKKKSTRKGHVRLHFAQKKKMELPRF